MSERPKDWWEAMGKTLPTDPSVKVRRRLQAEVQEERLQREGWLEARPFDGKGKNELQLLNGSLNGTFRVLSFDLPQDGNIFVIYHIAVGSTVMSFMATANDAMNVPALVHSPPQFIHLKCDESGRAWFRIATVMEATLELAEKELP